MPVEPARPWKKRCVKPPSVSCDARRLEVGVREPRMRDQAGRGDARRLEAPLEADARSGSSRASTGRTPSTARSSPRDGDCRVDRPAHVVRRARHAHDARGLRAQQRGQQVRGQREVAEVVDAELHLEAVHGAALGNRHHAGVVHQDVDPVVGGERCGPRPRAPTRANRGRGGRPRARRRMGLADALLGGRGLLLVARRHHDVRAGSGQRAGGLEAEASVGAGDDRQSSRSDRGCRRWSRTWGASSSAEIRQATRRHPRHQCRGSPDFARRAPSGRSSLAGV